MGAIEILTILAIVAAVGFNAVWMHQIYPYGNGTATGDNGLIGILQRVASLDFKYHLFTAPTVAINQTLTLAGLSEVSGGIGYSEQTVNGSAFTLVGLAAGNGSIMAAPISFGTYTGGGSISIYGYYVTDVGSTVLLAAANFDAAPIVVPNGGTFPVVIPVLGDFSQYAS